MPMYLSTYFVFIQAIVELIKNSIYSSGMKEFNLTDGRKKYQGTFKYQNQTDTVPLFAYPLSPEKRSHQNF
jgi:hypothetical protein